MARLPPGPQRVTVDQHPLQLEWNRHLRIVHKLAKHGKAIDVNLASWLYRQGLNSLAVHKESRTAPLHTDHDLVPLGIEQGREPGKGDRLKAPVQALVREGNGLCLAVDLHAHLLLARGALDLPDAPVLLQGASRHPKGGEKGVFFGQPAGVQTPGWNPEIHIVSQFISHLQRSRPSYPLDRSSGRCLVYLELGNQVKPG